LELPSWSLLELHTRGDLGVEGGEALLQLRHDAERGGLLPLRRQLGAQRRVPLRQRRDAGERRRLYVVV